MFGGSNNNNNNNVEDPFREVEALMGRLFNLDGKILGGMPFSAPTTTGRTGFLSMTGRGHWLPAMNLLETTQQYVLSADTAGMRREDMEVNVKENRLCVRGSRRDDLLRMAGHPGMTGTTATEGPAPASDAQLVAVHLGERGMGSFERCVTLPSRIREESVNAQYLDGVLTVRMDKAEEGTGTGAPINIR